MRKYFDKVLNDHVLDDREFDKVIYPRKSPVSAPSGTPTGPTADNGILRADTNLYTADSY